MKMTKYVKSALAILLGELLVTSTIFAQTSDSDLDEMPKVEVFMGADLNYRDYKWDHVYDVLLYLTPGAKWNIGNGWQATTRVLVPTYKSGYEGYSTRVRFDMLALSKEFNFDKIDLKATAGLFSEERYGVDLKSTYTFNSWFSLEGQFGWTGYCSMADGWDCSRIKPVVAVGGANVYLRQWQTQFRLRGGHFLYGDNGVIFEGYRHFDHCSVGAYLQSSSDFESANGGFRIIMMIPPYHYSKKRAVRIRPASNYRFNYRMRGDQGCRLYITEPEENERSGWYRANAKQWEK